MESVLKLVERANKSFQTADHLAYVTYPLLKDPKLMMTVVENLYNAMVCGMDAFLQYERLYKRIFNLPDDFSSKMDIFKKVAQRYNINREHIVVIDDLKNVIDYRRKAPVEFVRRERIIMCSDTYKIRSLNMDKVKEYITRSKPFFEKLNKTFKK